MRIINVDKARAELDKDRAYNQDLIGWLEILSNQFGQDIEIPAAEEFPNEQHGSVFNQVLGFNECRSVFLRELLGKQPW